MTTTITSSKTNSKGPKTALITNTELVDPFAPVNDPIAALNALNGVQGVPGEDAPAEPKVTAESPAAPTDARLVLPAVTPRTDAGLRIWGMNYVLELVHDAVELLGIESFLSNINFFEFDRAEIRLRSLYSKVLNVECNAAKRERDNDRARQLTTLIIVVRRLFDSGFATRDLSFAISSLKGRSLTMGERELHEAAWHRYTECNDQFRAICAEEGIDAPEVILHYYDIAHAGKVFHNQFLQDAQGR